MYMLLAVELAVLLAETAEVVLPLIFPTQALTAVTCEFRPIYLVALPPVVAHVVILLIMAIVGQKELVTLCGLEVHIIPAMLSVTH
jgi:hypothetical protein